MSQELFDSAVTGLSASVNRKQLDDSLDLIESLAKSSEIRDLVWTTTDASSSLYDAIWLQLLRGWRFPDDSLTIWEGRLLVVWQYIVSTPEYDHLFASTREVVNEEFCSQLLHRIVSIAHMDLSKAKQERINLATLKRLIHWLYQYRVDLRPSLRRSIARHLLQDYSGGDRRRPSTDAGDSRGHIAPLLDILHCIIAGFAVDSSLGSDGHDQFTSLLNDVLLPLHRPNEMVLWRDQVPVLQTYHESLVKCVMKLVEKDRQRNASYSSTQSAASSVLVQAVQGILGTWPDRFETNTPKQVLLLHELEMLLEKATAEEFGVMKHSVLSRLVRCIGTDADNIRPAQRALQWFKNPKIVNVLMPVADSSTDPGDRAAASVVAKDTLSTLLPALYRNGALSWNPTVNKMTALALKNLQARDEALFRECCDKLLSTGTMTVPRSQSRPDHAAKGSDNDRTETASRGALSLPPAYKHASADSKRSEGDGLSWVMDNMAAEKPSQPTQRPTMPSKHGGEEDLGSTGFTVPTGRPRGPPVMPRAEQKSSVPNVHAMRGFDRSNPPPVTITGVAPWAMSAAGGGGVGAASLGPSGGIHHPAAVTAGGISTTAMPKRSGLPFNPASQRSMLSNAPPNALSCTIQEAKIARAQAAAAASGDVEVVQDGHARMLAFIEKCLPTAAPRTAEEEEQARLDDWQAIQAAATPTLLPNLKFHDLVFGAVLGEGAFSTVKYARRITKDKTQSAWPEYAVKIIQASKIAELEYRSSVVREMAVLQLLSHPGVSRLISAFRYSDSAYMVLEYAAKGDLHTYVMKHGKLAHKYCRFVLGEVVAAIHFLHELGFSYGDLKPENVLITELGHIKVADFGACRAVTAEASALLSQSQATLETMRNGDWKEESEASRASSSILKALGSGNDAPAGMAVQADERLEGTPSYLPPEVLRKQVRLPGYAADAWALGCVAYFCLQGRPQFYGDTDQVLDQIYIHEMESKEKHSVHFSDAKESSDSATEAIVVMQDAASEDLIAALNASDHRARLSVAQAAGHPYLTQGVLANDSARLVELLSNSQVSTEDQPQAMNPLSLHMAAPLQLPVSNAREGGDLVDQQWARRQFSVLWAPMPAEYQLDDDPHAAKIGSASGSVSTADVWLMTHAYVMGPLEETETEQGARFL